MPDETKSSFDELYEKIERAVGDLTTLKVTTAVGDVDVSQTAVEEDGKEQVVRGETYQNAKAILSTIDLIDVDISTVMATRVTSSRGHDPITSADGIAIERAYLFAQSTELGVIQERNRLAREIHDTLAQGLAGLILQLEALELSLERENTEKAEEITAQAKE